MSSLSFLTPVCFEGPKTYLQVGQEWAENYFSPFSGRNIYVIKTKPSHQSGTIDVVVRCLENRNFTFYQALIVVSYVSIVFPILCLAVKFGFRLSNTFRIISETERRPTVAPSSEQPPGTASKTDRTAAMAMGQSASETKGIRASQTSSVEKKEQAANAGKADSTVASLMEAFTKAWNGSDSFAFTDTFDAKRFVNLLTDHTEQFRKKEISSKEHYGYIEKFDLDPSTNPQIYVRADLHGDLKSLIENIRTLQKEGLLDGNFKCKPGVHLVFLGDYSDRGIFGTQVLELLMRLREENPFQVHLIRGNHESAYCNGMYGFTDNRLLEIVSNQSFCSILDAFYETMSLTSYFSINGDQREYVQCTHGLFELTMDPAPLLDQMASGTYLPVPIQRKFSDRVTKLAESGDKLANSAKRLIALFASYVEANQINREEFDKWTSYNWGDITKDESFCLDLGSRNFSLNAQDIEHYLSLSSVQHRVMMLFRGHQHLFQHLKLGERVLATTLPVGMDTPYKNNPDFKDQLDRAYILKPNPEVSKWSKRALTRGSGESVTAVTPVDKAVPLTSDAL